MTEDSELWWHEDSAYTWPRYFLRDRHGTGLANVMPWTPHWRCYVYRQAGKDECHYYDTKEEAMAMAVALVRLS